MEIITGFLKNLWAAEDAKVIAFALFYFSALIYVPLKMFEVLGGVSKAGNAMIDDAAGFRKYVPPKRPMSDNNTSPIQKEPRYR